MSEDDPWFYHHQANAWKRTARTYDRMYRRAQRYNVDVARHLEAVRDSHLEHGNRARELAGGTISMREF